MLPTTMAVATSKGGFHFDIAILQRPLVTVVHILTYWS